MDGAAIPTALAHVNARKQGIYDFSFDYRNIAYFNALPSYSNPLAPAGFNEQAFDTHRRRHQPQSRSASGETDYPLPGVRSEFRLRARHRYLGAGFERRVRRAHPPARFHQQLPGRRPHRVVQLFPRHARSGRHHLQRRRPGVRQRNQLRRPHHVPARPDPGAQQPAAGLRHPRQQHLQQGAGHRQPVLVAQPLRPVPVQRAEDDCELYGLGDRQLRPAQLAALL
jgi:hypothetical protein